jgi:glycosyl transferase family 87
VRSKASEKVSRLNIRRTVTASFSQISWQPSYFPRTIGVCAWALLVCLLFQLADAAPTFAQPLPVAERATARDFVEYWSAARLFLQNRNPYSPDELLVLQRTAGWTGIQPLVMWNPPWVLLFVVPFGVLSFTAGQFLWLLFHVCLILISTQLLWRIYNLGESSRLSWVVALSFVPTVFVLIIGQIAPLVLAGLAWFLYSERKQNYWIMAAALILLSIKPNLLYLFGLVFLLWLFEKHSWRLFLPTALLGLIAVLAPVLFDTTIYSEYLALYGATGVSKPLDWPVPTLRNVIRIFFGADQRWLQFGPTVIAVGWAIYYWQQNKNHWRWREQLPLLSLVSVTSSIFVWTYDHVVLLPAIVEAAVWVIRSPKRWHSYWAARLYLAINACHLLLRFWLAEELWYSWLAPALLINYLFFCWERKKHDSHSVPTH